MRAQIQRNRAKTASLPAPTGGWNARDALSEMPENEAVRLDNWYPEESYVEVRPGYEVHVQGFPAPPETLMVYNGATDSKLYAVGGRYVHDVTVATTASQTTANAVLTISVSSSRWQYTNFATPGGQFLIAVDGQNDALLLDAADVYGGGAYSWIKLNTTSTPAITTVSSHNFINVHSHKNRIWFVRKDSLKAYYLPTAQIAGSPAVFDLGGVARHGGRLVAMGTWTIDAGEGVDDHAVFVTSMGEVLVYKGTDPSNASTWGLVGSWSVGAPLGDRCLFKFAGDLVLLSQDGVYPMSVALQSARVRPNLAMTEKISGAVTAAIQAHAGQSGWEVCFYPKRAAFMLNVPNNRQYVLNTKIKAWCSFSGWNAKAWALYNDEPYFVGTDKDGNDIVARAWHGTTDDGDNIRADGQQAFNYFGRKGQNKRFTLARPVVQSSGLPAPQMTLNVDFDDTAPTLTQIAAADGAFSWDVSTWDGPDVWGGSSQIYRNWQGVTGVGYAASPRFLVASNTTTVRWIATDIVMEEGGIL